MMAQSMPNENPSYQTVLIGLLSRTQNWAGSPRSQGLLSHLQISSLHLILLFNGVTQLYDVSFHIISWI